uniref:MI domain-containing protein n=1 Tax=Petromyzon marinus TaxID=7757 RepID=S4RAV6_PETMA
AGGDSDRVLRVSLEQLLSADRVGRWWIVGSSWSGAAPASTGAAAFSAQAGEERPELPVGGEMSAKMMELARKQRMNTDIRRGIFCVLMTSEDYVDYVDAFEKLVRMGLKEKQEREIVHVLMDCCLQEKSFNPYYAYLGQKLCQFDRRFKMTFQFSMWDRFKTLGNLNATATTNLVNVLSHLLIHKGLSVTVFKKNKALEFSEMDKLSVKFLRQVLQKLLLEASEEHLPDIFSKAAGNPKLALLREGLKIFMRHFMLRGAASGDADEAELLRQRIEVAEKALEQERNPAVNL